MFDASHIFYLAMFTLGTALGVGAWQLYSVKQSQKHNEHSNFGRKS
ncbi:MAG: hypothetical protein V2J20_06815 [Wenzhouxiangella sp.]|jgi:hypothetical protein|nr:hypothetical protein [Wenzhouxiangella sp.]